MPESEFKHRRKTLAVKFFGTTKTQEHYQNSAVTRKKNYTSRNWMIEKIDGCCRDGSYGDK